MKLFCAGDGYMLFYLNMEGWINRSDLGRFMRWQALMALILLLCRPGPAMAQDEDLRSLFGLASDHKSEVKDPKVHAMNHFSMAQLYVSEGRAEEAIEEIRTALRYDPDSARLREVLADLLFQTGKPMKAIYHLKRALKTNPKSASAHFLLARIHEDLGQEKKSFEEFKLAASYDPNNVEYVIILAQSFMDMDKPDEALATLDAFSRANPHEIEPAFYMGVIARAVGKNDLAAEKFNLTLKKAPTHYPALSNLFELELSRQNLDQAARVGMMLIAAYPGDIQTRDVLVDLLVQLGKTDEALATLAIAQRMGPPQVKYWLKKGYLLLGRGDAEAARREFEAALLVSPESVEAVYALGVAESALGSNQEAILHFETVPVNSELFLEARRQIAMVRLRMGQSAEAPPSGPPTR